jgi:hypothetical protein
MKVADGCLPVMPSLREVTARRAELGRREVRESADPRWHLEAAHLRMVWRDRALVELLACGQAGYVDLAEAALRRFSSRMTRCAAPSRRPAISLAPGWWSTDRLRQAWRESGEH